MLNKYTKAVQNDRPFKKRPRSPPRQDRPASPRRKSSRRRGDVVTLYPTQKMYATMPWMPPASNATNPAWEHGGYGCSISRCLILHIIKGKALGCRCMTDWDHANPVQCSRLHRSDRYTPTGQTGLIRGRVKLLFQGLSIASKKRGGAEDRG